MCTIFKVLTTQRDTVLRVLALSGFEIMVLVLIGGGGGGGADEGTVLCPYYCTCNTES